ncbi:MAG: acetylornithine/succinylornithine family transaminase [Trueperaceae bacterium]
MPQIGSKTQEILAIDQRHGSGLWQPDLALVRGDGTRVWDADGKEYIDCLAGIAVASLGHANPRLTGAIAEQAGKLIAFAQNIGNDTRSAFLEKLFEFVPPPLSRVFMANSGSEVNEAALKWAKAATGRSRFVAAKRGFSGRTLGVLGLTWEPKYREPFEPLPVPVDHVTYNDVASLEKAIGEDTAAVFIEPVQGEGGIHPATEAFMQAARDLSRERGALLVFDEIQSGVGRTGKFLACEHYGVGADMVTLAKGLGGGVPIGALLMTEEVAGKMPAGGHGTTFGGNPLSSAAGLAVLQEIESRGLLEHVTQVGDYFRERLIAIGSPKIREVRGLGLLIGVELREKAAPFIAALREAGVLTINAGGTVIRFVPPLVIGKEEVDEVVKRVAAVLAKDAP